MRQQCAVNVAAWALSWLMPASQREALLGDLAEEYALRASAASSLSAFKWYLRQVCASIVPLLWSRLIRTSWIATLGVALFAYIAVGVAQLVVNGVTAIRSATGAAAYNPLAMVVTFPLVVLIGYFAAGFRSRAPIVLGAIMLLNATAMALWSTESVPAWYTIAFFFVGPVASLAGSALRRHPPQQGP